MSELNLSELEAQRAALDAQIAAAKAESIASAVAEVKALMEAKGVTLEMLGGRKARAPRKQSVADPYHGASRAKHPSKGSKVAPRYASPDGKVWSGRGLKPVWLREAIAAGASLESFLIR